MTIIDKIREVINKSSNIDLRTKAGKERLCNNINTALELWQKELAEEAQKFPKENKGVTCITRDGKVKVI